MKKYLVFAASALALASCQNDEFLGEVPGNVKEGASSAINFNHNLGTITRAGVNKTGKDAADLLEKFYILGTKGTLPDDKLTGTKVFDNYVVQWVENSAGTTEDNTDDWKYVGVTQRADNDDISKQTIKYWDYSTDQYDFIAYSIGDNTLVTGENPTVSSGSVYGSLIATPTTTKPKSFSIQVADVNDLKACYITDVVTVKQSDYGKPVNLVFKNLSAKVRMAFYETVPGYTVSDIKFYSDATAGRGTIANTTATLFASSEVLPTAGTIDVKYPKVGTTYNSSTNPDYNKAFVDVNANSNDSKIHLGTINYSSNVLATTAKEASMAGELNDSYYTHVFPCPTGQALTLCVDYTLTSTDGSGETITVYGATAVIPATYTQWQPNYAYTYIFKISDNTNGFTSISGDKSGLFPITFDAVVRAVDDVDFNQETITTVSAPSVTTYAFNNSTNKVIAAYNKDNEYPAAATTEIYFSVSELNTSNEGEPKTDLNNKGKLYSITATTDVSVTEAEVIDALQIRESTDAGPITGRNGIALTEKTTQYPTTIPTEDGKGITVTENSVAKFTADTTPTTYAYVYLKNEGTPSYIYTAVQGNGTTAGTDEYYEDPNGTTVVPNGTTLVSGNTYYKKYTNNNNVYGVKVVRTTSSGN